MLWILNYSRGNKLGALWKTWVNQSFLSGSLKQSMSLTAGYRAARMEQGSSSEPQGIPAGIKYECVCADRRTHRCPRNYGSSAVFRIETWAGGREEKLSSSSPIRWWGFLSLLLQCIYGQCGSKFLETSSLTKLILSLLLRVLWKNVICSWFSFVFTSISLGFTPKVTYIDAVYCITDLWGHI